MTSTRIDILLGKYLAKRCTEAEKRELMTMLAEPGNRLIVEQSIDKALARQIPEIEMQGEAANEILKTILAQRAPATRKLLPLWARVAAIVLVIVGAGYGLYHTSSSKQFTATKLKNEGGRKTNGAVLTLSNGKKIELDEIQTAVYESDGVALAKTGTLVDFRKKDSEATHQPIVYNTLSTPSGKQYQVILPDGTKVWLNAGSSLAFPSRFEGAERKVTLSGEGYFEVAKNKDRPFLVTSGSMTVHVLGTHFNINAFADNGSIITSLVEGSVKITRGDNSGLLKPGQQAAVDNLQGTINTTSANLQQVLAWKSGLFQFDGADIHVIMGEIGRWYNLQIVYKGEVPRRSFEGKISRTAALSEVLKILELSDVKFVLNGNQITVGH